MINSNSKTKFLKGHQGVVAQLFSLEVQTSLSSTLVDLKNFINDHAKVFREIIKDFPLVWQHEHAIQLQPLSPPLKITPYTYTRVKE